MRLAAVFNGLSTCIADGFEQRAATIAVSGTEGAGVGRDHSATAKNIEVTPLSGPGAECRLFDARQDA